MKQILILSCIMLMTSMYTNGQEKRRICSYCNGTGVVECNKCRGKGYLVYSFGPDGTARDQSEHNMKCPQCNRSGKTVCPLKDEYPQLHPSYHTNSNKQNVNSSDLVDNSKKIKEQENHIKELESKKQHCYYCHGTGKTQRNCTMCLLGWSGYGKYKHPCTFCSGTGKITEYCSECKNTNMAISFAEQQIKMLKETHGMKKETAAFYYEHQNKMAQMNNELQKSINEIAEPYIERTRKSNSSHSSTSSSSKCSMCNGTGIDPARFDLTFLLSNGLVVGYYNKAGTKCPYCKEYSGHKHIYCPKCQADKHAIP